MQQERRRFSRVVLNIPTSLSTYHIQGYQTGVVTNLSSEGCFLQIDERLPVGERCELILTVGEALEAEELALEGEIVRLTREGAGIRFAAHSRKKNDLLQFMKRLSS